MKNAFNTMSREAFLSALVAHPTLQALLPLACQFYIEPSRLLVRGAGNSFVELASESGQRQGCAMALFLFAMGLQPILEEVAALFPGVTIHAICDDIYLCGKDDEVAAAHEELRNRIEASCAAKSLAASFVTASSRKPTLSINGALLRASLEWFAHACLECFRPCRPLCVLRNRQMSRLPAAAQRAVARWALSSTAPRSRRCSRPAMGATPGSSLEAPRSTRRPTRAPISWAAHTIHSWRRLPVHGGQRRPRIAARRC